MDKVIEFLKKLPTHKKILIGYAIAVLIIFVLAVPWTRAWEDGGVIDHSFIGYSPLWLPGRWSQGGHWFRFPEAIMDWGRIIAEFVTVTVIAGIAFYLNKEKKAE